MMGVHTADHIPKLSPKPAAIITNLYTSHQLGSYWVTIYIDKNGHGICYNNYGVAHVSLRHIDRLRKSRVRCRTNNKCKASTHKYTTRTALCFCIIRAVVYLYKNIYVFFYQTLSRMTR